MKRGSKLSNNSAKTARFEISARWARIIREGILVITGGIAFFLLISLISYHAADPGWSRTGEILPTANLGGQIGAWLADICLCIFGYAAYIFPLILTYSAWLPLSSQPREADPTRILLMLRSLGFVTILLAGSSLADLHGPDDPLPFGAGGILGNLFQTGMVNLFGMVGAQLLLIAMLLAGITLLTGISWLRVAEKLGQLTINLADALGRQILQIIHPHEGQVRTPLRARVEPPPILPPESPNGAKPRSAPTINPVINHPAPIKSSPSNERELRDQLREGDSLMWSLPALGLLDPPNPHPEVNYTAQELEGLSHNVELRLRDFGIEAQVVAVHPGPVITRLELQLAAGTKVNRITALSKDLARSLSVTSVRVVEVIPGKSVIGLELPNLHREIVGLREILSSQQYENSRAPLALALGKDIAGYPVVVDLAKMPHLLVAGTTGAGKSVCINALLLSLLYKYPPQELRLILLDPKMLELSIYSGIPHLLAPVIIDMKEAIGVFRWCVAEMELRYKLMASLGVRNLASYNRKVREAKHRGQPLLDPFWQAESNQERQELNELPYIVVIADEYADMMMIAGKKVEELITRIAQKARAAGIHLILATQRPSVDVITGLIKANIPTRIAFQVSSKIDSRTILDQGGAEQLLGAGDMLYLPPGSGLPVRIHGAFVKDEEVHRVVKDLQLRGEPKYIAAITDGIEDNHSNGESREDGGVDAEQDPLYDQAVGIVLESRRASVSNIQRRLKIGYNRAARMVDAMESAGLVGPMESNGNREILVAHSEE